jgi:hypothetical protein
MSYSQYSTATANSFVDEFEKCTMPTVRVLSHNYTTERAKHMYRHANDYIKQLELMRRSSETDRVRDRLEMIRGVHNAYIILDLDKVRASIEKAQNETQRQALREVEAQLLKSII